MRDRLTETFVRDLCGQFQYCTSGKTNSTPDQILALSLTLIPTLYGARGRQGQSRGSTPCFGDVFPKTLLAAERPAWTNKIRTLHKVSCETASRSILGQPRHIPYAKPYLAGGWRNELSWRFLGAGGGSIQRSDGGHAIYTVRAAESNQVTPSDRAPPPRLPPWRCTISVHRLRCQPSFFSSKPLVFYLAKRKANNRTLPVLYARYRVKRWLLFGCCGCSASVPT